MKKFLKISLLILVSLVLILVVAGSLFIYKVKNGFPVSFETEQPAISFPENQRRVLLFSKSTGFRHGESIEAGKQAIAAMASKNNWFLHSTEEGGVFNKEQLAKFDVVIFNNSTGRVLNDEQQIVLEQYVTSGGSLIGIHGSGDDSHHWAWYEQSLPGSKFSHHPLDPQLQETEVILNNVPDSALVSGLPASWSHTDEWYVFFENPRDKGFQVVYHIDGTQINPSGNILWMKDKDFGMGKHHPVAWYKHIGNGRTFYTSIGHAADAWSQPPFIRLLENAIAREERDGSPN